MNIKVKKLIRNSLSRKEFEFENRLKSRLMKLIAIIIILLEQNNATQNLNDRKTSKPGLRGTAIFARPGNELGRGRSQDELSRPSDP